MATSWYYASGNRQVGPLSEPDLDALVASGTVRPETLVWREGMTNWAPHSIARPEVVIPPQPPSLPRADAAPAEGSPVRYCTECGQARPERELASFGDRLVCASCKPAFTQHLRERGMQTTQFRYAGFWIRFLARIIDAILLYMIFLPMTFMVLGSGAIMGNPEDMSGPFMALQLLVVLVQVGITVAYESYFVYRFSATLGKMAVGKKVINADGSKLTLGRAVARYFCTWISSFTLGIGYIMAGFDSQKRSLHDRILDTRVVAK